MHVSAPAAAAHNDAKGVASDEEQLAAHNGASSAGFESVSISSPIRPSDLQIVISRQWDGVFSASRTPEDVRIYISRSQENARSDAPASHIRFCKTRFIVFNPEAAAACNMRSANNRYFNIAISQGCTSTSDG
jgi:hypothetical protein